ncbi:MAG: hypothetical protein JRM94_02465 [Nitrososphaerota archaeon]|nr:hypothetical protein [Nitrososphaerota archaeon]MDG6942927.1 hypothetical protein [Nitrososphaerota archaeon]
MSVGRQSLPVAASAIVVAFGYSKKKLKGRKSRKPLAAVAFMEKFGNQPTGQLLSATK